MVLNLLMDEQLSWTHGFRPMRSQLLGLINQIFVSLDRVG